MRIHKLFSYALFVCMTGATTSWAVPPVTNSFHFSFAPSPMTSCGSFDILWGSEIDLKITTFFDSQGLPIREFTRITGTDTFINSVTGAEVTGSPSANQVIDFTTGELRGNGRLFQVVIPGMGTVLIDAGLEVLDADWNFVAVHGKHQWLNGDFDELCNALTATGKPGATNVDWGNLKRLYR